MSHHPFDQALQLMPGQAANTFAGATAPDYWNMVGPFGGYTAALAVRAVMQHPALLGEPVALTVNYAGATTQGPFTVTATPARTSRSTQHASSSCCLCTMISTILPTLSPMPTS